MTHDPPTLRKIRATLDARSRYEDRAAALAARTSTAHIVPKRAQGLDDQAAIALFRDKCQAVSASFVDCDSDRAIVRDIAAYLNAQALPQQILLSRHPLLAALPWHIAPDLAIANAWNEAPHTITTACSVAFCGISETGSLVMVSGKEQAMGENFLPMTHLVLLPKSRLVGTMEAVWSLLRTQAIARSVTMITGPSRTGDIEQRIELGAHGPLRLHILLASHR